MASTTTRIENVTRRLNDITVGHTTTVAGVVVTRWQSGFELDTVLRADSFDDALTAATRIVARVNG